MNQGQLDYPRCTLAEFAIDVIRERSLFIDEYSLLRFVAASGIYASCG
jgi:hypothetical protein